MKNLFAMLAIAAIMTLPAGPMLDAGKTVAADADTIIAHSRSTNRPSPPGWSGKKPKKTTQLEVLPGGIILAKKGDPKTGPGGWPDSNKGWSNKPKK